ncbi:Rod shape-determining protein MreC [Piscirickettsia salmonis]|uniref:rod shape-determining protein MreC n=1 Tax=Piscirickettsia salmonis TaxID=1238 RepID=UPI0012B90BFE|nr:rod shape-determining protein MreC [Piscirickettsia salmonis]QGP51283.1 Rod shape-determining protein MreC [Piscirickettsia salmonis]QGP53509.1 Rod shape-determining protein MreC [Piscirickettsia salmonis]QGP60575.1 Rod shape-determining protein MreC [Piscirickettsia salmonis]QGP63077.1 Rod shape-determining protein MreC [Piscirickettsia salmonis]
MQQYRNGRKRLALHFLFWFGCAWAIFFIDRYTEQTKMIRITLSSVLYPFEYAAAAPYQLSQWLKHSVSERYQLFIENKKLNEEVVRLQVMLQQLLVLKTENQQLQALLNASHKLSPQRYRLAKVLQVKTSAYKQMIVVDQGISSGVYIGQPVVDAYGVLGQVVDVGLWSAKVLLLSDSDSALPVFDQRSGVRAILSGQGKGGELELKHVPDTANIQMGDVLLTSGMGGRFPVGYPVGVVRKVVRHPGSAFAQVAVDPAAHMDRGRLVMLVWQDKDSDSNTATHMQVQDKTKDKTQKGRL